MKTLKNVYIKATKGNVKELNILLKKHIKENDCLLFESESIESVYIDDPKNRKKVTLAELKRLIDTIPTREEIKRLKQQISAYKMNYDKIVKHSLSKNDVIEELKRDSDDLITQLFATNQVLKNKSKQYYYTKYKLDELKEEYKVVCDNYDDSLKEIDSINYEKSFLSSQYYVLKEENAQLKQRKWWQIWK